MNFIVLALDKEGMGGWAMVYKVENLDLIVKSS